MKKSKTKSRPKTKESLKDRKIINGAGRDVKLELLSLVFFAFTLLVIVSFIDLAGAVGNILKVVFFGLFGGITSWVLIIFLCYVIIFPFGKDGVNKVKRAICVAFFSISFCAMVASFATDREGLGLFEYIGENINSEVLFTGGIIGGFFSYIFKLLFSEIGALIVIFAFLIASIILMSKHSIFHMFSAMVELFRKDTTGNTDGDFDRPSSKPMFLKDKVLEKNKQRETKRKFRDIKDFAPDIEDEEVSFTTSSPAATRTERKAKNEENAFSGGNINFNMKENPNNKNTRNEVDPLAEAVKDIKGENKNSDINMFAESPKEKIARNTSVPNDSSEDIKTSEIDLTNFNYVFPSFDLLNDNNAGGVDIRTAKLQAQSDAKRLEMTLKSFGVEARVINICRGPAVTRYELQPNTGVKISKIVNLADDITMSLAAKAIRIEAPIPGKGAVGIEIPNKEVEAVFLKDVIATGEFEKSKSKLSFCLGKDISGETILADVSKMPHMLIAGATGSGKSVCINSLIISLLYKAKPQELRLIMIDPKVVELSVYNGIPHLEVPVVTDPKKAAGALQWAVSEMEKRYRLFAEEGVRDLAGYNSAIEKKNPLGKLPHFVIIVDELADLMMVAPGEIESNICRLAQMARAAGMHLIIATQRPSVDVITGVIKANIPSRIAFKVASQFDSRTILDSGGAEKLLGRGDMMFFPMGASEATRIQGAFISDGEVERIISFIKSQGDFSYNEEVLSEIDSAVITTGRKKGASASSGSDDEQESSKDKILDEAIEMVVNQGTASASYLQRKFGIGYSRAARIIDQMEEMGIVSGNDGSKPRQVLMSKERYYEMKMNTSEE